MKRLLLPSLIVLAACGATRTADPTVDTMVSVDSTTTSTSASITGGAEESLPPDTTAATSTTSPSTPISSTPTVSSPAAAGPSSSAPASGPRSLTCDADSGSAPSFNVAAGSNVTLVATSSREHEFHLHNYDIELSGTRVTFQFTATILGPSQLTLHPGHEVVCTVIVS